MEEVCENPKIPERLHKTDRLPDQTFEPSELLFRRFKFRVQYSEWYNGTDVSSSLFPLESEGDSYNREKYSDSYLDVLLNAAHSESNMDYYGVFQIPSKNVINSVPFKSNEGDVYTLKLIHDPEICMYPHTIVKAFQNDGEKNKKSKQANAQFRDELKENLVLLKPVDLVG